MSKSDLVNHMADKAGISKASAADALDALVAAIEDGIADGNVRVPGLGTFTKRHRAARTGRNPRTGEPIQIAASYSVGFKAAKNLKDAAGR
ncbi:MAG: HU family DNA-binding protein [Rhodospirillales bacterium]|nr:HU family DNA-binding protein [Rhodospirillales bacterium]